MKKSIFTFLLVFLLLTACSPWSIQSGSQDDSFVILNHEKPDLKIDFSPFENIGCNSSGYGWYQCTDKSPLLKIGCTTIARNDLLGGLTPNYPIAECGYFFHEKEPLGGAEVPPAECFSTTVMLNGTSCKRLIIFKDGYYFLIKNLEELRTLFAPVDSPDETLGFVLAIDDYSAEYGQTQKDNYVYYVQNSEDTYVETIIDGYLVHVFYTPVIGCGPFETEAVEFKVTRDGNVLEVDRYPVYRDPSEDTVCVD